MKTLENLIEEISRCEQIMSQWNNNQKVIAKRLMDAVEYEIIYRLLSYHQSVKSSTSPLEERIQQALGIVRAGLKSHNGDVALVAI